jgi:hypothetical protein
MELVRGRILYGTPKKATRVVVDSGRYTTQQISGFHTLSLKKEVDREREMCVYTRWRQWTIGRQALRYHLLVPKESGGVLPWNGVMAIRPSVGRTADP